MMKLLLSALALPLLVSCVASESALEVYGLEESPSPAALSAIAEGGSSPERSPVNDASRARAVVTIVLGHTGPGLR